MAILMLFVGGHDWVDKEQRHFSPENQILSRKVDQEEKKEVKDMTITKPFLKALALSICKKHLPFPFVKKIKKIILNIFSFHHDICAEILLSFFISYCFL